MKNKFSILLFSSILFVNCTENNKQSKQTEQIIPESTVKDTVINVISSEPSTTVKLYQAKVLGMGDEYCTSRLIMSIKSDKMRAIGIDCSDEYSIFNYYEGEVLNNSISGKSNIFDNCGGDDESNPMCINNGEFNFTISKDTNQITINGQKYNSTKILLSNSKIVLYDSPSKDGKVILEKQNKSAFELIEIGPLVKVGKLWKVWCKIKLDGEIGWGLDVISI